MTGTNFVTGASVGVPAGIITVGSVIVVSPTSDYGQFHDTEWRHDRLLQRTVTHQTGVRPSLPFAVTAPVVPAPTLTGILPSTGIQGSVVSITLSGTNFVTGATSIAIVPNGVITIGSVNVVGPTSMTADFTIPIGATIGPYDVNVTTSSGTSNVVSHGQFAVAPLTVTGQSSVTGTIAGGQRMILTGTNIPAGPVTVAFGGVYGAGAQRLSATQIAVYTPPHVAGAVNVIVTAEAESVTRVAGYTYAAGKLAEHLLPLQTDDQSAGVAAGTTLRDGCRRDQRRTQCAFRPHIDSCVY